MIVLLPMKTVSVLNQREHWAVRAKRSKSEREAAYLVLSGRRVKLPATVKMTRIGPRPLDDDNLRGSLKAVRDGIADKLQVDDADPRVTWKYAQARGKYAVEIDIQ